MPIGFDDWTPGDEHALSLSPAQVGAEGDRPANRDAEVGKNAENAGRHLHDRREGLLRAVWRGDDDRVGEEDSLDRPRLGLHDLVDTVDVPVKLAAISLSVDELREAQHVEGGDIPNELLH